MDDEQLLELRRQFASGERKLEKYPGALAEPIFIDPAKWPEPPSEGKVHRLATRAQIAYQEKIDAIVAEKFNLLFWLYGIDLAEGPAVGWEKLARALVSQHVPGFAVTTTLPPRAQPSAKKGPGAPRKYSMVEDAFFVCLIDAALQEKRKARSSANINDAIKHALKRGYLGKLAQKSNGEPLPFKSVQSRYYEALNRWKKRPFNALLLDGDRHSPQTLAKSYLGAVFQQSDHK